MSDNMHSPETPEIAPSVRPQRVNLWLPVSSLGQYMRTSILPWIPLIISLISITISLYTFFSTRSQPDMLVVLPRQVRIAQGGATGAWLYLEPTFLHSGPSDRVEAVVNLSVLIESVNGQGQTAEFIWDETGSWQHEITTQELSWRYASDPGPFLVGPRNAAKFTGLFIGPDDWRFAPGAYRMTLAVARLINRDTLIETVELQLRADEIEYLNGAQGARFLTFPVHTIQP